MPVYHFNVDFGSIGGSSGLELRGVTWGEKGQPVRERVVDSEQWKHEQWKHVQNLFYEAMDASPGERGTFIANHSCDADVKEEVLRLLELHRRAGLFLRIPSDADGIAESSSNANGDHASDSQAPTLSSGTIIGHFKLQDLISVGGMGEVWSAIRAGTDFQQRVAVKVLREAWQTDSGLELFQRERQTLAKLEHESITRLIDGGAMGDGRPYLVMEFVDGLRIDKYCDSHRLDVVDRIRLMIKVCDAVAFAHQNLIIHRDLKPTNILIQSSGQPKLLDFGIADLVASSDSPSSIQYGSRAFSPQYAAPEQFAGQRSTTATDVYSLGLILRDLVAGPRSSHDEGLVTMVASRRLEIPDQSELDKHLDQDVTNDRSTSVRKLRRVLQGDLREIVQRAVHPVPSDRYSSVNALRDDLQRWTACLPVSVRDKSAGYRLRCAVKRNRLVTFMLVLLTLVALVGVGATVSGWNSAAREAATARAATAFLESVLGYVSPFGLEREPDMLDLLNTASNRAETELKNRPAVAYRVRMCLGRSLASLWLWESVLKESELAVELAEQVYGDESLQVADALALHGRALTWHRKVEGIQAQRRALAIRQDHFGDNHATVAECLVNIGFGLWTDQQIEEAEEYYRAGIDMFSVYGDEMSTTYGRCSYSFASFLSYNRQHLSGEILETLQRSTKIFEGCGAPPDHYRLMSHYSLGYRLLTEGYPDDGLLELEKFVNLVPPGVGTDRGVANALWQSGKLLFFGGTQDVAFDALRRAYNSSCYLRVDRANDLDPWKTVLIPRLDDEVGTQQHDRFVGSLERAIGLLYESGDSGDSRLIEHMAFLIAAAERVPASDSHELLLKLQALQSQHHSDDAILREVINATLGSNLGQRGFPAEAERSLSYALAKLEALCERNHSRIQFVAMLLADQLSALGDEDGARFYLNYGRFMTFSRRSSR